MRVVLDESGRDALAQVRRLRTELPHGVLLDVQHDRAATSPAAVR